MGGKTEAPPAPDFSPILKVMDSMRSDQAKAAEQSAAAQERAVAESQNRAAQLAMNEANASAAQDMLRRQQYQQTLDALAKHGYANQASTMGHDVVGPAFDINEVNQAKMSGLNQIASGVSPFPYNLAESLAGAGGQSRPLNQFSIPNYSGINFR